jgi:hypothetical protein
LGQWEPVLNRPVRFQFIEAWFGHRLRAAIAVLLSGGYEMGESDEVGLVTVQAFHKPGPRHVRHARQWPVTVPNTAATGGGEGGGARVQDHNSSRSNKPSG